MNHPKYLGETPFDLTADPVFSKYAPSDWAMYWIDRYGQIDGDHHKTWVLDQVAQILTGATITAVLARWDDGQEDLRLTLGEPTEKYKAFVQARLDDGYGYNTGIAP